MQETLYETPYKGPSGIYHVKLYNTVTKKRTTRSTKARTMREAQKTIDTWKRIGSYEFTLSEAADRYLSSTRHRHGWSRRKVIKISVRYWKDFWEDKPLRSITHLEVGDFLNHMMDSRGWKASTVNKQLFDLRGFFKWCVLSGLVERDPTAQHKPLKTIVHEKPVPSSDEVRSMLFAALADPRPWVWPWLAIGFSSGLRTATIMQLDRGCYYLGPRTQNWTIPGDKMKNSRPLKVPMSAFTRSAIEYISSKSAPNWKLFEELTPGIRKLAWEKILTRCELPRNYTPHMMRRYFITSCLRNGGTIKSVAILAGSLDYKTLIEHYEATEEHKLKFVVEPWDFYALDIQDTQPNINGHDPHTKYWRQQPLRIRNSAAHRRWDRIRRLKREWRARTERKMDEIRAAESSRPPAARLKDILEAWGANGELPMPGRGASGNYA